MNMILSIIGSFLLVMPRNAAAQIMTTIDAVDAGPTVGDATFPGIANFLRDKLINTNIGGFGIPLTLIDAVGIFLLIRAGLKLINSQDDSKLTSAKTTIAATLVGLMLAHLSNRLVEIFFGSSTAFSTTGGVLTPGASAAMLSLEIGGIINWVLTLIAVLGVLMIVVSGIRTIASFGKDDGLTQLKQTVFGTVTGIFFLIVSGAVKESLGLPATPATGGSADPSTEPLINRIVDIAQTIMTYLGLIAVAVVVYAGFLMILNLGNEDQFSKARSLILRALIGLLVVMLANTIASFVISLIPS